MGPVGLEQALVQAVNLRRMLIKSRQNKSGASLCGFAAAQCGKPPAYRSDLSSSIFHPEAEPQG